MEKFVRISILIFICFGQLSAQECDGNLGNEIFSEDFGSGVGPGPSLPSGTTTYTFGNIGDGSYVVTNTTGLNGNLWHTSLDHTPNDINGYTLLFDASRTPGVFYRRNFEDLCANTNYSFSVYAANIVNPITACSGNSIEPNLTFNILDPSTMTVLGSNNTGNIGTTNTLEWNQYSTAFTTNANQQNVLLEIINNTRGGCGNDLVIDDISFNICNPTREQEFDLCALSEGMIQVGTEVFTSPGRYETVIDIPNSCNDSIIVTTLTQSIPDFTLANSNQMICTGYSFDLNTIVINGTSNLSSTSWHTATPTTTANQISNLVVNPTSNTTYYLRAMYNVCSKELAFTVEVNDIPDFTLAKSYKMICTGYSFDLNTVVIDGTSNLSSASWHTATPATTANQISNLVVNPTSNTTYYLRAMDNVCSKELAFTVEVNDIPDFTLAKSYKMICTGYSFDLNTVVIDGTSNLSSASWHTATPATTANQISNLVVNPTSNTTYYLRAMDNVCNKELAFTVEVNDLNDFTLANANQMICTGSSFDLNNVTINGSSNLSTTSWHTATPATTANQLTNLRVNPTNNTTYYVLIVNEDDCIQELAFSIIPEICPISISVSDPCDCKDLLNKRDEQNNITHFHDILIVNTGIANQNITLIANRRRAFLDDNLLPIPNNTLLGNTETDSMFTIDFFKVPNATGSIIISNGITNQSFELSACSADSCKSSIPTMSEWGLIIFSLLVLNLGLLFIGRKEKILI